MILTKIKAKRLLGYKKLQDMIKEEIKKIKIE